jgi:hypothetical protein
MRGKERRGRAWKCEAMHVGEMPGVAGQGNVFSHRRRNWKFKFRSAAQLR